MTIPSAFTRGSQDSALSPATGVNAYLLYFFCFAITLSLILSYVACGTMLLVTSWRLLAYGLPAIIFCE